MALEVSRVLAGAHDDPILCVAYNAVNREVWTGCQGGKIRCWEEKTGTLIQEVSAAHKGWVTAMEYVARHDYLVTCGVDGTMVCRTDKGKELQRVDARGALFCLAYGARRDLLITGGRGSITIFRLVTINTIERNKDPADRRIHPVRLVCVVPDVHTDVIRGVACDTSGRIFTGSYDRSVCVFEGEQFERMQTRAPDDPAASLPPRDPPRYTRWPNAHDAAVSVVSIDPINAWILTGSYDGSVKVWTHEGAQLMHFAGFPGVDKITGLCHSPATGTYWASGGVGHGRGRVHVLDPRSPLDVTKYIDGVCGFGKYGVTSLHASRNDGRRMFGVVADGVPTRHDVVVWRFESDTAFRVLSGHEDWVEALVRVPTRGGVPEEVYSVGGGGTLFRWRGSGDVSTDVWTKEERIEGGDVSGGMACACYSADLGALVTGCEDGTLRIWEPSERAGELSPNDEASSTDGASESGSEAGQTPEESRLEDYLDGEESWLRKVMPGHQGRVAAVCELWDHSLASAGMDRTIRFWDLQTRKEAHCVPDAHENAMHSLERCALREEIATAALGEDRVKIWRASGPYDPDEEEGARLVGVLAGHVEAVTAVKWCEWREVWITASNDRTFRLWCPRALETTRCLTFRGDSITAMALDARNGKVLAAMTDRKMRVFDLARMEGRKDKHGNWIDDGVKGDETKGEEGEDASEGTEKPTGTEEGEETPKEEEEEKEQQVEEPPAPRVPNFAGIYVDDDAEADHIFCGHADLIRAIVCTPGKAQYMTAGCDGDVRVWLAPDNPGRSSASPPEDDSSSGSIGHELDKGVGEFERKNPLVVPESIRAPDPAAKMIARQLEETTRRELEAEARSAMAEETRREREMSTKCGRMLCGLQDTLLGRGDASDPVKTKVRAGGR